MNPLVARAYFLRGLVIWAGVRAIASAVLTLASIDPTHFPASLRMAIIAIAIVASLAQTLRLREGMLLANLGVGMAEVVAWFAAAAIAGETLLATAIGLVA